VPPHQNKNQLYSGFGPVVDGVVLPHHPFDPTAPEISKNKPLLVGWNEDEYTFFAMQNRETEAFKMDFDGLQKRLEPTYGADTAKIIETYRKSRANATAPDIFVAVSSVNMMGLGSIDIAERKARQNGAPVYLYNFGYKSETKIAGTDYAMGTPHAMDISFKFNNVVPPKEGAQPTQGGGGMAGSRPERFKASHNFAELWATFARTGKPGGKDLPKWPAYNLKTRPTMRIDSTCEIINDRFSDEMKLWRSVGRL
jgi:para-nitrobenzyl esterase